MVKYKQQISTKLQLDLVVVFRMTSVILG